MAIGQSIDGDVYISGCGRGIALVNQQILDLRACGRNIDDEQGKEQPCDRTKPGKHGGGPPFPLLYYSCDSLGPSDVRSYRNPEAQESKGAGIPERGRSATRPRWLSGIPPAVSIAAAWLL